MDARGFPERVSASRYFAAAPEDVWRVADSPAKLSRDVPMLRSFSAPSQLAAAVPILETHTILGIPQRYAGEITVYDVGRRWGMATAPVSRGPAPLPHEVVYEFEPTGTGTTVRIECAYRRGGVLAFFAAKPIIRWGMERVLQKLLASIDRRLTGVPAWPTRSPTNPLLQ